MVDSPIALCRLFRIHLDNILLFLLFCFEYFLIFMRVQFSIHWMMILKALVPFLYMNDFSRTFPKSTPNHSNIKMWTTHFFTFHLILVIIWIWIFSWTMLLSSSFCCDSTTSSTNSLLILLIIKFSWPIASIM